MKTKSLPIKSKLTLRLIIASLILSLSFNLVSFAQSAAAPEKPKTNISRWELEKI